MKNTETQVEQAVPLDSLVVPKEAHALRLVRFLRDDKLQIYEAITFPKNPYRGCEIHHRREKSFGHVADKDASYGLCDILDDQGDIIADFPLTHRGFIHLKNKLGCRVEK